MDTMMELDEELVCEAQRLGGFKTKREAAEAALREFIQRQEQVGILELAGTIDWDSDYERDVLKVRGA
ncbi:MAG: DUF2191 domain-containing protein [Anaerolinea sp.]|nr:DUF2191 domain-containing protein [Anaerolinea sp.]